MSTSESTAETNSGTSMVRVTRTFAASAERVFDAWLDPAMAKRFLFAAPIGEIVTTEIDARVGGGFRIVRRDDRDIEHVGRYLEIDRPRKLVFTFAVPAFSPAETLVTIDIVPAAQGCELTLTHEHVLPDWADRTAQGWGMIVDGLNQALGSSTP
jgi:uncharacterized protein YndB with AHSA1/START domain